MSAAADLAYVTLALVPGIGRTRLETLLATFGTPESVLSAPVSALAAAPGMTRGAAAAVAAAAPRIAEAVLARTVELGATILTPSDARFPVPLTEIPDAPTLLFGCGALDCIAHEAVAVVGSRTHSPYGADACRHFAAGLARAGLVVVSGLARGLDAIAHAAALDAGGRTIGVLGHGLGVVYPARNRALFERMAHEGCLLTEVPPDQPPKPGAFPRRNRLISGLARVTLVIEASGKSGALLTADRALQQGRDVLAVPGPITSPTSAGCNRLIQQGAKPALGLRDVLEEYGLAAPEAPAARLPTDLCPAERRFLDLLADGGDHVDRLARRVGASSADVLAVLTSLEIRGLVTQEPGKIFRRAEGLVQR